MAIRFLGVRLLPAALLFLSLLVAAVLVDWLLHAFGLAEVGRWLGPFGSGLLVVSFLHSMRKRKWTSVGSPRRLLQLHETLGWLGALVLLVHGGVHLNAWIPWLALGAMTVVVASGLTGKVLLARARADLGERRRELQADGLDGDELEARLLGLALLVKTMQQWRRVHMPLTMVFAALALVHVLTTLALW